MKKSLLKILICPLCKNNFKLKIQKENQKEILEGILKCKCNEYKINNGIPRMVINKDLTKVKKRTANVWGYQWNYFKDFIKESEEQFLRWLTPIKKEYFKGKLILDAGCGTGRHSYFSSKFGGKVIAIDLSNAVETAKEINKDKNVEIVQADIYNLPFKDNTFDFIYSIGVIHHLPDPSKGVESLIKKLKPGKQISIWLYGYENSLIMVKLIEPFRKILKNINLRLLNYISLIKTIPYFLITKLIYRPVNKLKIKILENIFPYNEYFYQFSSFGFNHHWMNVFDKLNAPLANYYKKEEARKLFKELKDVTIYPVNNISWTVHGIK